MSDRDVSFDMGRVTQALDTLTQEVGNLRVQLGDIKSAVDRGRGFTLGLIIASGGVSVAASAGLNLLLK